MYPYVVTLPSDGKDYINTIVEAITVFGLPGDKYRCSFVGEHMQYWFKQEADAILFELKCG